MRGARGVAAILWAAVALVLLRDVYYLILGLSAPLVADHSYRQSQTALVAFWMYREGPKLAYEMPVFGSPWAIPLEFPFYQWLVAALRAIGVPIDVGGRLLSFGFLLACGWPLAMLRKSLALPRYALPITLILFLSAPIYVYWGRAVLIETCALFLALLWLAVVVKAVRDGRPTIWSAVVVAVIGSLAILQKATTFPVFGLMGGCFILAALVAHLRRTNWRGALVLLGFGAAACLVPLGVGVAWINYSDGIKLLNPLAGGMTSAAMAGWNYGTWAQRYSPDLWLALQRAATDTFGRSAILAGILILAGLLVSRRHRIAIAAALAGFLAFFAIFTNLHIVHNYYQVANAVLLVVALALSLTWLVESRHALIALVCLLAVVVGQNRFFATHYLWSLTADLTQDDRYRIARRARDLVKPDEALLVLGQDYSSLVNYYSERKGIALTTGLSRALIEKVLADPEHFLGGMRLGGIVACRPFEFSYEANQSLVDAYLAGKQPWASAGQCALFAPSTMHPAGGVLQ